MIFQQYGPIEKLQLTQKDIPDCKDDEMIVQVKHTTVNDFDWSLVQGKPIIYRLIFGVFKPKNSIPGIELAGTVLKVGSNVKTFQEGDHVYGDISGYSWGTFAEYVSVRPNAIVKKPDYLSFVDAAATSHASMLAYQALFDAGKLKEGMKVLVNGAGGGVGVFALQMAKIFNATVTGVDSVDKHDMMKSIGYDQVIDYRKEDFIKNGERYDLIVDTKTTRWAGSFVKCLNEGGKYVTVGGDLMKIIQVFMLQKLGRKNFEVVGLKPNKDLDQVHEWYKEGRLKPIIDGPYPIEQSVVAFNRFGKAQHQGKVVVAF